MPWLKGLQWRSPKKTSSPQKNQRKRSIEERELLDRMRNLSKVFEERLEATSEKKQNAINHQAHMRLNRTMQELKTAIHRMEAAMMSSAEIRRAQAEWKQRMEEECGEEAGSPLVRHEILRSEAEARALMAGKKKCGKKEQEKKEIPVKRISITETQKPESSVRVCKRSEGLKAHHLELEAEHMIPSIRALSREAVRASKDPEPDAEAIAETLRCMKDLHGKLKKQDRKKGIRRDRVGISDGFRYINLH